ncbi:uncharacterized protein LOC120994352 isoform X1 [Bufo bufo]|uniref:uncharacterized protein LOC120994352 isoform X1 n=1 Tax=Bufo bufo TaxID=8384 RepID=UPI001ABEBCF9|nr:uncharacterized protein LOC120994352 isoform X1 [Bufo bufo]XP_040278778.1 uncharacterized protein LOC120994352 isoform X1 [Bufo bufo]
MAALNPVTAGVIIILAVLLPSSDGRDVQRGSDITSCSMKCPDEKARLSLYKDCGGDETFLVELRCDDKSIGNVTEPRFHLDTSSGCWTLTGAGEEDSCVYSAVDLHGTYQRDLTINVTDPVLITNNTSNSSRLGEDIAVSVNFSEITDPGPSWILIFGVSAGIGFLIFPIGCLVQRHKRMKLRDLENDGGNDHSEEHGRLSSSSPDADEEKKTGWRHLMNVIGRLCRNRQCEEPPQIEMEEKKRLTTPP